MPMVLSDPSLEVSVEEFYSALDCTGSGKFSGSGFRPEDFSLWRITWELAPNAGLNWGTSHGDEALYVLSGTLESESSTLGADSVVIIEAGVAAEVRATDSVRFLHFGPTDPSDPDAGPFGRAATSGRRIHCCPFDEAEHIEAVGGDVTSMAFFADGTCPTCRIAFFMAYTASSAGYTAQSHTHSEDEIIHVLDGTLTFGSEVVEPGMSIAIPGSLRYGFRTTGPFRMLNYRRDASTYQGRPGTDPFFEIVSTVRGSTLKVD